MVKIIGVRFRTAGKIYYFDPLNFEVKRGDHVIVETARGIEYGTVVGAPKEVGEDQIVSALKPVLRVATPRDVEQEADNKRKEKEAFKICQEKIKEHELDMKLIDAEYTFDNNKVLFYFTADGRIDFRDLVKDLASVFRTRIELRQIGVRDETKIRGGIGVCGRPLCCNSYLSDFIPVSIKMAKEQNLSLNPTKISGMCGRLMCCLKNEQETYEELNRKLPTVGDAVICPGGYKGEVNGVNVLRQTVRVLVEDGDDKEIKEFPASEIHFHHHKNSKVEITEEELQAVRELEEKNDVESLEPEDTAIRPERKGGSYRERSHETRTNRSREMSNSRESRSHEKGGSANSNRRSSNENRAARGRESGENNETFSNNRRGVNENRAARGYENGENRGRESAETQDKNGRTANKSRKSRYERGAGAEQDVKNTARADKTDAVSGDSRSSAPQNSSRSSNLNVRSGNGRKNSQGEQADNSRNSNQSVQSGGTSRRKNTYRGRKNRKSEGNEKSNET